MQARPAVLPRGEDRALVIGIETATQLGAVGLAGREGILGEITLRSPESHSERILPAAERLLDALGIGRRDLAAVAVSSGPGSFTGLRTGIAAAKGLAFSLGVPLYGVPTLLALASNVAPGPGSVCAVLDARRGEVFRAVYRHREAGLEPLLPEAAVAASTLPGELPDGCLVVGEWPGGRGDALGGRPWGLRFAPAHLNHPRAVVVALLGLELLRAGRPTEIATLAPRYLRPSDAEAGARPPLAQKSSC